MTSDQHIENIITQTSVYIMDRIGKCMQGNGVLNIREVEDLIRLAVNCGRGIGVDENIKDAFSRTNKHRMIPVIRMNVKGDELQKYPSIAEAARDVGIKRESNIRRSADTGYFAGGYKWKYA